MPDLLVPVSPGELIDRLTIQDIKAARFEDPGKRVRAAEVRTDLRRIWNEWIKAREDPPPYPLVFLMAKLKVVNEAIWLAEDECRIDGLTDEEFGAISRQSHDLNEERFQIKRDIDLSFGTKSQEDKSYI